jgi:hypothetical protein
MNLNNAYLDKLIVKVKLKFKNKGLQYRVRKQGTIIEEKRPLSANKKKE